MASVYQKRGTWYLRFKDASGRWRGVASKAHTKTEAKRLAYELERKAERQRHGLDPLPSDSNMTLGELCTWWLRERCPAASVAVEMKRLGRHVLATSLGALPLRAVTSAAIDARLREMEREGLGPHSTNGLRGAGSAYNLLACTQGGTLDRPESDCGRRATPRADAAYVTLRTEEVPTLLAHVPASGGTCLPLPSTPACARASCSGSARPT